MRLLLPLCSTLALLLLPGCKTDVYFHDDFDSQFTNQLPAFDPPGDPVGDTLYSSAGSPGVPGQLVVVNDSTLGSHALRYANVPSAVNLRYLGFQAAPVALTDSDTYWAIWNGVIDLDPGGSDLRIWVGDSHFGTGGAIVIDGDGTLRVQTSQGASPSYEDLGTVEEGVEHTVIWTFDRVAETYAVSILQPRGVLQSGVRPVLDTAVLSTTRPMVYFWYHQGATGAGSYVSDDIEILVKEPATP
ncbi:MAG: hypothetical protein P1V81_10515 [Planctomycetota bacterium]|nr:hypothetical protein [Planctomycetota bacterium]